MVVSKEGKRRRKVTAIAQAGATNPPGAGGGGGGSAGTGSGAASASNAVAERDLSPPEIPKRPKVHAQRKFAQGQGAPSSSYLNYSSAPPTPAKDGQNSRNSVGAGSNGGAASNATGPESIPPPVTELLPNMRPNTEDFLTFLCFRGTTVLPPALDFFNKSANSAPSSGGGNQPTASTSRTAAGVGKGNETAVQSPEPKASNSQKQPPSVASEKSGNASASHEPEVLADSEKPAPTPATTTYMPFAVRKRAEQHPVEARPAERKRTQDKMQALRKKYHDQRVAKLRATNQGKQSAVRSANAVANTRSSRTGGTNRGPPTESSENEAETDDDQPGDGGGGKKKPTSKMHRTENNKQHEDDDVDEPGNGDEPEDEQNATNDKSAKVAAMAGNKRKSSLRSGSVVPSPSPSPGGKGARNSRTKRDAPKSEEQRKDAATGAKRASNKGKKSEPDPVEESPKASSGRANGSGLRNKTSPAEPAKAGASSQLSPRDGESEKRTTRLSALRGHPATSVASASGKSSPNVAVGAKEKEKKPLQSPVKEPVDYSSEDDEPLSRSARTERRSAAKESAGTVAVSKSTRSARSRRSDGPPTVEKEPDETPDKKLRRSESVVSRRSDISSKKSAEVREASKKTPQQQHPRGTKRKETPTSQSDANNEKDEDEPRSPGDASLSPIAGVPHRQPPLAVNANKRKRGTPGPRTESTKTPENGAAMREEPEKPVTPVESLGATGRPSRKTKEAATLYMELIGRKLNHDDKSDDDDASSLDSLELPNVRKLEKMENELKANAGKKDTKQAVGKNAQNAATLKNATAGKGVNAAGKREADTRKKKAAATEPTTAGEKEEEDGGMKPVAERSFSDSDEEPLASKFQRKKQQTRQQAAAANAANKGGRQQTTGKSSAKASPSKKGGNVLGDVAKAAAGHNLAETEKQVVDVTQTKVDETIKQGSPTATTDSTPARGTPKRVAASPVGKQQNGTVAPSRASSNVPGALKPGPNKAGSKVGTTPQPSPVSTREANPGSATVRPLNKSLDNTLLSTTVEASESPIKIPQVLNIPILTTAQPTPFTRTARPTIGLNASANSAGLDNATGTGPALEKSTMQQPQQLGPGTTDSIPFNRPAPVAAGAKGTDFTSLDEADFLKGFDQSHLPTDPSAPAGGKSTVNSLLGNLLPSKEESEKIFGIASVSLAQSSGPLDTKCTLGKCGSVHKPPLGPPVLTESLLGGNLSPRDRRKAKVNMTHEQIQKWIDESSWSPIEDDLRDDDDVEVIEPTAGGRGAASLVTGANARSPPPTQSQSHVQSTSSGTTSAAQSAAAAAAIAWERLNVTESPGGLANEQANGGGFMPATSTPMHAGNGGRLKNDETTKRSPSAGGGQQKSSPVAAKTDEQVASFPAAVAAAGANATDKLTISEQQKSGNSTTPTGRQKKDPVTPTTTGKRETAKEPRSKSKVDTSGGGSSMTTNAPQSRSPATTPTTPGDRKPIYRTTATGRTPVYKQEALHPTGSSPSPKMPSAQTQAATNTATMTTTTTTPTSRLAVSMLPHGGTQVQQQHQHQQPPAAMASNKFGAFSPVNETSVYSFDKEEDFMPVATPFRRQHSGAGPGRRESCNSSARDEPTTVKREPTPVLQDEADKTLQKQSTAVVGTAVAAGSAGKGGGTNTITAATVSSNEPTRATVGAGQAHKKRSVEDEGTKGRSASVKPEVVPSTSDTEVDASGGGQTFYIPLQGTAAAAAAASSVLAAGGSLGAKTTAKQLIQGVAVKLGTEGPDGPNQRVIMHAKLVTKAEMGSNTTTLPELMHVQELVKSLTQSGGSTACALSKEGMAKLVPIGTVQPRFKAGTAEAPVDDRNSVEPPMSRGGLSRINSNSSLSSQRSKPTKPTAVTGATGATSGKGAKSAAEGGASVPPAPQPDNNTVFPRRDDPAQMVEAPVFKPTEKEFHDPMEYIERIAPVASRFGICRIIPPASFKPECRIADDMRFMAYNQYVHKMLHRWGPSAKEYAAIKKYLATQSINLQAPPVIGGMEVDLPRLYHTVQELGGLKEVIEKKRWARVSEDMCIPKAAHDRVSKLDDVYCKYLLPYDTLSPAERQKLFDEVEADWAKREAKARRNADKGVGSEIRNSGDSDEDDDPEEEDEDEDDEEDFSMECIVKGRSMPLNQFFRIARNTMSLWFKNSEPTVAEIEAEYWRHVAVRDSHVCVHSGSIDSSAFGFGFPSPKVKGSSCAKHPWNLKVLTNNSGSILRSLGPVMGITIPTLHVGMLFSACCWYRDPHGLPWIEYLHTGANKIWYGVPDDQNANFRAALTVLVPTHCQNKTIWLPCDTAMVPPHMLTDRHVSLCRTEQQPGQFVVVFPRAYTSSLCTGYAVSESVYFATNSWLDTAKDDFRDIQESCEPTMFSVEQLLFAIANDQRTNHETLVQAYPMIVGIYEKEKQHRQTLKEQGVTKSEKIESKKKTVSLEEFECERCRANLYLSLVKVKVTMSGSGKAADRAKEGGGGSSAEDDDEDEDEEEDEEEERIYCLKHAVKHLTDGGLQMKHCRLAYTYSLEDIEELLRKLQDRIASKKCSKSSVAGSSTGGGGGAGAGGCGGGAGTGGAGGGSGKGKSSLHLASTSSQSSSSYQAPSHSKFAGMATMLK